MNKLYKWIILLSLIFAALACYGLGIDSGFVGFVMAGVLFEMMFWFGLLSFKKKKA